MPNRRSNRRKRSRHPPKNDKPKPFDIDKMIQDFNEIHAHPSLIKLATFMMERQVYGTNPTTEFVVFCLSSYFLLKNHYSAVSLIFDLPPEDFLQEEALRDFKFPAGISSSVLELLKIKTEHYEPLAKICILVVDEIALKSELGYSEKCNSIIGFEDNGQVKTKELAHFVTNIWLNCVGGQWLIPLAYYFTNKSCSPASIKDYLFEAVSKLDSIGLNVIGVVTKMRSNFFELSQMLNISRTKQTFKVGNREIVFIYDVPQLMNITRNNMMKYKLTFNDEHTSWKYIKQFFINDHEGEKKTKLTIAHVKPDKHQRSCPKLSIELLSNSVATEMNSQISLGKLPESAAGTADYIDIFDKLFDVLNSSNEISMNDYCNAYKGSKHQVRFMEKMIRFFEELKVFNNSDEDCTDQIKFINGWLISIKGVMKIWEGLSKKKYPFLLTRNINCEVLDKFVWLLRFQIFSFRDPTPSSFMEIYSSFFVSSYFMEQANDESEFDIRDYAKKIADRIPPLRHDLSGKTKMSAEACASGTLGASTSQQQHSPLDIFGDFMETFLEIFEN